MIPFPIGLLKVVERFKIEFRKNLDMLLLDCPARNLSMMPNGLGYVHNALKKTNINYQTFDLDMSYGCLLYTSDAADE